MECKDCGGSLLFAARELGTGLCHHCAHKHYAGLSTNFVEMKTEKNEPPPNRIVLIGGVQVVVHGDFILTTDP